MSRSLLSLQPEAPQNALWLPTSALIQHALPLTLECPAAHHHFLNLTRPSCQLFLPPWLRMLISCPACGRSDITHLLSRMSALHIQQLPWQRPSLHMTVYARSPDTGLAESTQSEALPQLNRCQGTQGN